MDYQKLFDSSLDLDIGESIKIPVISKAHQDAVRVSLARQRRIFVSSFSPDFDILVRCLTIARKRYVLLTKVPKPDDIVIIKKDGTETKLNKPSSNAFKGVKHQLEELARMKKLMKEDGFSDQEIEDFIAKEYKNEEGDNNPVD